MPKFYITTAIDYANSRPHVGHAFEKVGADVMARYRRLRGDEVCFLMGTDEHSSNVEKEAQRQGLPPRDYCDRMEERFREVWSKLRLSNDDFIRTTQPRHIAAAQEIYRRIRSRGDIYPGKYSGPYCVGCEAWKQAGDLENGRCPNHPGTPLQHVEEENLFFRLTKYRDEILRLIRENPSWIEPEIRRNEVLNVLESGLQDISISRQKKTWGVPLPDTPGSVLYVWFDALINYISATGFPADTARFEKWWPADVHVIGKDITRFHCIIWPAMLLSAGLPLPKQVVVHGFVYFKEGKMSKSEGRIVDPAAVADQYGPDALRYFLLRDIAFDNDGEFSWDKFIQRFNSDLANDLGNLLHRVVHMIHRYLGGTIPDVRTPLPQDADLKSTVLGLAGRVTPLIDRWQFHQALAEIWDAIRKTNTYLEQTSPWTRSKDPAKIGEVAGSLVTAAESLRTLAIFLSPFLPVSSEKIWESLGVPGNPSGARWEETGSWPTLAPGTVVRKGAPLFPRIETPPPA